MDGLSEEAAAIVGAPTTKSDKIRALDRLGLPRARIADALAIRYQHVRNVLEHDRGVRERGAVYTAAPEDRSNGLFRLEVGPGGTVRLPQAMLDAFDLREGQGVMAQLEGEFFTLRSTRETLRRIRALMGSIGLDPGRSASEELIAERRLEALREGSDD